MREAPVMEETNLRHVYLELSLGSSSVEAVIAFHTLRDTDTSYVEGSTVFEFNSVDGQRRWYSTGPRGNLIPTEFSDFIRGYVGLSLFPTEEPSPSYMEGKGAHERRREIIPTLQQ